MSKFVKTSDLKFLDVIASDRFVHGCETPSLYDPKPIEVGYKSTWPARPSDDPTRSNARFVVLSVGTAGNTDGLGGPYDTWTQVIAQRLNDDLTFNPDGEVVSFPVNSILENNIEEVALMGRMRLLMTPIE